MEIINKNIDDGTPFDWGRTSSDYAKYRDIYPELFYDKIINRQLCITGQDVLDLGTGTGIIPRNLYRYGAKWTAIDISDEQLQFNKANSRTINEFIEMDMKAIIRSKIEKLFSKEFYCSADELNGKSVVYSVNINAKKPYIKILAYRNCVVICTSEDLYYKVRELVQSKNRDEIFELPLVYGQTIHYVPNDNYTQDASVSLNFECEYLFDRDILSLTGLTGFENSIAFDENDSTSTKAVYIAKDKNRIIGVAGAAESSVNDIWEIGVDVMEEYRNARLGTYLVRGLTKELLARNIIPFYSASVTNIGSQMVASRCDYIPFWIDTFGTILDGSSVYNDITRGLSSRFVE